MLSLARVGSVRLLTRALDCAGGQFLSLIVVFQPYRVYRTRYFEAEIAAALSLADEVVIMEVFGPGEVQRGDLGPQPVTICSMRTAVNGCVWPRRRR